MKRNLINGNFSLDSRDQRIFEAMISNLNSFLKDADRKVKNHPASSLHIKEQFICLSMVEIDEQNKPNAIDVARSLNNAIKDISPDHAIEFPEPHMGAH